MVKKSRKLTFQQRIESALLYAMNQYGIHRQICHHNAFMPTPPENTKAYFRAQQIIRRVLKEVARD